MRDRGTCENCCHWNSGICLDDRAPTHGRATRSGFDCAEWTGPAHIPLSIREVRPAPGFSLPEILDWVRSGGSEVDLTPVEDHTHVLSRHGGTYLVRLGERPGLYEPSR